MNAAFGVMGLISALPLAFCFLVWRLQAWTLQTSLKRCAECFYRGEINKAIEANLRGMSLPSCGVVMEHTKIARSLLDDCYLRLKQLETFSEGFGPTRDRLLADLRQSFRLVAEAIDISECGMFSREDVHRKYTEGDLLFRIVQPGLVTFSRFETLEATCRRSL